jgi:MFS family permease
MEHRWIVLLALLPLYISISYAQSITSSLAALLKDEFEIVRNFSKFLCLNVLAPRLLTLCCILQGNGELGVLFASHNIPNIVAPLIGASIASRVGSAPVVIVCALLSFLGVMLQAVAVSFMSSFPLFLIGRILFGIGAESCVSSCTVWLVHRFSGHSMQSVFIGQLLATAAGHICAYAVAPSLAGESKCDLPFWIATGLMTTACILALAIDFYERTLGQRPEFRAQLDASPSRPSVLSQLKLAISHVASESVLLALLIVSKVLMFAFEGTLLNFAPDYYHSQLQFTVVDAGLLVALSYFLSVCLSPLLSWCSDQLGYLPVHLVFASLALLASVVTVGFFKQLHLLALPSHAWILISLIAVHAASSAVFQYSNSAVFLALAKFQHLGEMYGLLNSLSNSAAFGLQIAVGYGSYVHSDYSSAFLLLICVAAAMASMSVTIWLLDFCKHQSMYSVPGLVSNPEQARLRAKELE